MTTFPLLLYCSHVDTSRRFYYAGDTGYDAEVFQQIGNELGPFDLAAIPIGAYDVSKIFLAIPKSSLFNTRDFFLATMVF